MASTFQVNGKNYLYVSSDRPIPLDKPVSIKFRVAEEEGKVSSELIKRATLLHGRKQTQLVIDLAGNEVDTASILKGHPEIMRTLTELFHEFGSIDIHCLDISFSVLFDLSYYTIFIYLYKNAPNGMASQAPSLGTFLTVLSQHPWNPKLDIHNWGTTLIPQFISLAEEFGHKSTTIKKINDYLGKLKEIRDIIINLHENVNFTSSEPSNLSQGINFLSFIIIEITNIIILIQNQELGIHEKNIKNLTSDYENFQKENSRLPSDQAAYLEKTINKLRNIEAYTSSSKKCLPIRTALIKFRCEQILALHNPQIHVHALEREIRQFTRTVTQRAFQFMKIVKLAELHMIVREKHQDKLENCLVYLQNLEYLLSIRDAYGILAEGIQQRVRELDKSTQSNLEGQVMVLFIDAIETTLTLLGNIFSAPNNNRESHRQKLTKHIQKCSNECPSGWGLYHDYIAQLFIYVFEKLENNNLAYKKELQPVTPSALTILLEVRGVITLIKYLKHIIKKEFKQKQYLLDVKYFLKALAMTCQRHARFTNLSPALTLNLANNLINQAKFLGNIDEHKILTKTKEQINPQDDFLAYEFLPPLLETAQNLSASNPVTAKGGQRKLAKEVYHSFTCTSVILRMADFMMILQDGMADMQSRIVMPALDDSWLDEFDIAETTVSISSVSDSVVLEEEACKEEESIESHAPIVTSVLPNDLSNAPRELITLFRQAISHCYGLVHPNATPFAVQKFATTPTAMATRQQLYSIDCLGTTLQLQRRCQTVAQRQFLISSFLLWGHQTLEQGLTRKFLQCQPEMADQLPHELSKLMVKVNLQTKSYWAQESDCATKYFRYPFFFALPEQSDQTPLAIQHFTSAASAALAQRVEAQMHDWLIELMNICTSAAVTDANESKTDQLLQTVQQLSVKMRAKGTEIGDASCPNPLHKSLTSLLNLKSESMQATSASFAKMISEYNSLGWDPRYNLKKEKMQNAQQHLNSLSTLFTLVILSPDQKFLYLHVLMAQLLTQSLAENIGRYLSIVSGDEMNSHDLGLFCACYNLDKNLTTELRTILESIDIRKGSEYLIKRFMGPNKPTQHARMKWISDLYEYGMAEDGFTPKGKKPKSIADLQKEVVKDLIGLADLSAALFKNHFLDLGVATKNSVV